MELFSRRRWTTGSAQQSNNNGIMPCMCSINVFGFNINTTAFCLDRSSLHLLLQKRSMTHLSLTLAFKKVRMNFLAQINLFYLWEIIYFCRVANEQKIFVIAPLYFEKFRRILQLWHQAGCCRCTRGSRIANSCRFNGSANFEADWSRPVNVHKAKAWWGCRAILAAVSGIVNDRSIVCVDAERLRHALKMFHLAIHSELFHWLSHRENLSTNFAKHSVSNLFNVWPVTPFWWNVRIWNVLDFQTDTSQNESVLKIYLNHPEYIVDSAKKLIFGKTNQNMWWC